MKPARTEHTNLVLYLTNTDDERDRGGDLPAERAVDQNGRNIIITTWTPDEGEQRALANGAPIELRLWGNGHPPVNLAVGTPDIQGSGVLLGDHVNRALGLLFAIIADRSGSTERDRIALANAARVTPDQFITTFHQALLKTAIDPTTQ